MNRIAFVLYIACTSQQVFFIASTWITGDILRFLVFSCTNTVSANTLIRDLHLELESFAGCLLCVGGRGQHLYNRRTLWRRWTAFWRLAGEQGGANLSLVVGFCIRRLICNFRVPVALRNLRLHLHHGAVHISGCSLHIVCALVHMNTICVHHRAGTLGSNCICMEKAYKDSIALPCGVAVYVQSSLLSHTNMPCANGSNAYIVGFYVSLRENASTTLL